MTAVRGSDDGLTTGMRWVARVLGLLASGLFVFFLVCAGIGVCRMLSWGSLRGMPLFIVLTMAAALTSGLLDLNIPEPTKTPSEPSCIIRAASAGVATPPAAKLTTGSLPVLCISSTSSKGAPISLETAISSS